MLFCKWERDYDSVSLKGLNRAFKTGFYFTFDSFFSYKCTKVGKYEFLIARQLIY